MINSPLPIPNISTLGRIPCAVRPMTPGPPKSASAPAPLPTQQESPWSPMTSPRPPLPLQHETPTLIIEPYPDNLASPSMTTIQICPAGRSNCPLTETASNGSVRAKNGFNTEIGSVSSCSAPTRPLAKPDCTAWRTERRNPCGDVRQRHPNVHGHRRCRRHGYDRNRDSPRFRRHDDDQAERRGRRRRHGGPEGGGERHHRGGHGGGRDAR